MKIYKAAFVDNYDDNNDFSEELGVFSTHIEALLCTRKHFEERGFNIDDDEDLFESDYEIEKIEVEDIETKKSYVVLVENKNETFVGGVFDSVELANSFVKSISKHDLAIDNSIFHDYVEINERTYATIQACALNKNLIEVEDLM